MTSLRRLFPAALAALPLSLAVATAAHAAVDPAFGDPFSVSAESTNVQQGTLNSVASTGGSASAVFTDIVEGHKVVLEARLSSPTGSWSAPVIISDPNEDVGSGSAKIIADSDGNLTAAWNVDGAGIIRTTTRLAGDPGWGPIERLSPSGDRASNLASAAAPDGKLLAAWTSYRGGKAIRVSRRAAGGASWTLMPDVDANIDSPRNARLDVNATGDAIVLWDVVPDGVTTHELRAARYSQADDQWSGAALVTTSSSTNDIGDVDVALAPSGAATVVWCDPANGATKTSSTSPGAMDWSSPETITADDKAGGLPQVASDRQGTMVATFMEMTFVPDDFVATYGSSRQIVRTRDAQTGEWSPAEGLMADRFGGGSSLAVDRNYNMALVMASADVLDPSRLADSVIPGINVAVAYRPDGDSEFNGAAVVAPFDFAIHGGPPGITLDEHGNPLVIWPDAGAGDARTLKVAFGDANGPELNGLSVPSSGTVGEALTFSVNPFDDVSGLDMTSWSFGEGADATGSTVTRSFSAPGTYTVRVTARDLSGLTTTATRTIAIAAEPVDEPDDATPAPPKVLAPVLEARLSGKLITLNTRVNLRAGKKCSGKATATTVFGTTTYRTTLKLAKVDGKCIGTGTIKLRKTPSARTKLRVTVSAKHIKTRTLTTKRA